MFQARETQPPRALPAPPSEWAVPYQTLAAEVGLDRDLSTGHRLAADFLDPVLRNDPNLGHWDIESLEWRTR